MDGYDLDATPQLKRELKRTVASAYRSAVSSFGERLVDAGLAEQFVTETALEELAGLDRLQERLGSLEKRLARPNFYELYRGTDEDRAHASRAIDPRTLEFVSRPALVEKQESQRLLVLGPGGSGKSRALAELVVSVDREIEHIIAPGPALQSSQDLGALRAESFEGDVLLVWDDIHAISPETGNTVFRKAVTELETILEPEHKLYVLAGARTNRVESLPGDVWNDGSPLWSKFEVVELGELGKGAIGTLFDRVLASEGVTASEDVREAFVEKAQETDPSPLYVTSVVETAESDRLTVEEIEVLPEDSISIWANQYAEIKAANDERRFVLWGVKLLSEVTSEFSHSLLNGVYAHVLGRDELSFDPPVEELRQRQWLVPTVDEERMTTYTVHDIKIEAIDESIEKRVHEFSTFLLEDVEQYLQPAEPNGEHTLQQRFASVLEKHPSSWNTEAVGEHYKRSIGDHPRCPNPYRSYGNLLTNEFGQSEDARAKFDQILEIDPDSTFIHTNYATILRNEFDAYDAAKEHYERALDLDSERPVTHGAYADLLSDVFGAHDEAKEHFERALELDPEHATIHRNYAYLLSDAFGAHDEAKEHYERALDIDPERAPTHKTYADLLIDAFGAHDGAKEHYERALDINPERAAIHHNYAYLLSDTFEAHDEAKEHYERALDINPERSLTHKTYADLLSDAFGAHDGAKEHYERALDINPERAAIHHNYAYLLSDAFGAHDAAKEHFEKAIELESEAEQHHRCYADLLMSRLNVHDEAKEHFEKALKLDPEIALTHISYAEFLITEAGDLSEGRSHIETALQRWPSEEPHLSHTFQRLLQVCQELDDVTVATEYCERGLELTISDAAWFEAVHAILTDTDLQTRYTHALTAVLEDHDEIATELFERVWTSRNEHPPDSDAHHTSLSAGVALGALDRHDGYGSNSCDALLHDIDPTKLHPPANTLYKHLDGNATAAIDPEESDDVSLEQRAFTYLQDRY